MKALVGIAAFEAEARASGMSPVALLDARAKAQNISPGELYERLLKPDGLVHLRESARGSSLQTLEAAFQNMGHSSRASRVAAAGRRGLHEAGSLTRHEDPGAAAGADGKPLFAGGDFGAADYLWTPDKSNPDSWWGLLTATPGGAPDPEFVRGLAELLDPSNLADGPNIPEIALPDVLATLRKAWLKAIPDEGLPPLLTEAAVAFLKLGYPVRGIEAAVRGRSGRR